MKEEEVRSIVRQALKDLGTGIEAHELRRIQHWIPVLKRKVEDLAKELGGRIVWD